MSKFSLKREGKLNYESIHNYQILDAVQDVSLYRICQLSTIITGTSQSLIAFFQPESIRFKGEVGISIANDETISFLVDYLSSREETVMCLDIDTLALSDEILETFGVNGIKSLVGLPLRGSNGTYKGCLVVFGEEPILLDEKSRTAIELLGSEALIIIEERKLIADFSNVERLFTLSNDLICIAGTDGYFKKINPSFTNLLGWDNETLLTRSFFEMIHPEDVRKTITGFEKLAKGKNTIELSHRFLCKDGSYKVLEWVATPDPKTGNIYSIARDTTDSQAKEELLSKSERRLRAFFENSQGLMCTHDLQGVFISVNEAGANKLGYASEQVIGRSLYDIVPEDRHLSRMKVEQVVR